MKAVIRLLFKFLGIDMTKIIKPPLRVQVKKPYSVEVFLAGTIDMGNSIDWQTAVGNELLQLEMVENVFNPRRDDWDSSWVQEKSNLQFFEQVSWELDHISRSNVIYFFFGTESKSPITMLELGKVLGSLSTYTFLTQNEKPAVVVCCEDGFYRKGNIDIICDRAGVQVFGNYESSIAELKKQIYIKHNQLCSDYGYVPLHTPYENQAVKLKNDETGRLSRIGAASNE